MAIRETTKVVMSVKRRKSVSPLNSLGSLRIYKFFFMVNDEILSLAAICLSIVRRIEHSDKREKQTQRRNDSNYGKLRARSNRSHNAETLWHIVLIMRKPICIAICIDITNQFVVDPAISGTLNVSRWFARRGL